MNQKMLASFLVEDVVRRLEIPATMGSVSQIRLCAAMDAPS
jgi:hypothetical protein